MLCATCLGVLEECENILSLGNPYSNGYVSGRKPVRDMFTRSIDIDRIQSISAREEENYTRPGPREAVYGHHMTLEDLENAARSGCQICWQVWDLLSKDRSESVVGISAAPEKATFETSRFNTCLSVFRSYTDLYFVDVFYDDQGRPKKVCGFYLRSEADEWHDSPTSEVISSNTASRQSLGLAKKWLDECCHSHSSCAPPRQTRQWYPTRLLDLGDSAQDGTTYLRLITSNAHSLTGPYTTLSHRWAKAKFLQLKRDNFQELHRNILISDLPRTFREAIEVSRALQVRYLWIDSLCIIQGDESDWRTEASLMQMVYSNSCCNISAAHAEDSSKGLFRARDPRALCSTTVDLCLSNFNTPGSVRKRYVLDNESLMSESMENCPLNKRGWVLQERILAPRVLHFCRDQLFWECRLLVACELYDLGMPSKFTTIKTKPAFSTKDPASWFWMWKGLMESYSKMSLTHPSDKLVAISGIAQMVRSGLADEYLAGMWRRDLVHELGWLAYPDATRPSTYRAPSWSFLSVDGQVDCVQGRDDNRIAEAEVVNVHIEYVSEDKTGDIRKGWLDLKGSLRPVRLQQSDRDLTEWKVDLGYNTVGEIVIEHGCIDDSPLNNDEIIRQSAAGQHFCIVTSRMEWEDDDVYTYLVLRLVNGTNEYERVGMINTSHNGLLQDLDEDLKRSLPCIRYEDGKHTIRII